MLLKWMICQAEEEKKEQFSQAQQGWSRLTEVPGLCKLEDGIVMIRMKRVFWRFGRMRRAIGAS
nr:DUF4937 domain-containing protein [Ectobacillus panaciterrae]